MIDWHETHLILPKTDINGNRITGLAMVRTIKGKRQYRPLTQAEQLEYLSITAW